MKEFDNDFLDNLGAEQYRKMHKKKEQDLFEVIPKWKEWKQSLTKPDPTNSNERV